MLGKLKKSMVGAKEKIKMASSDLLDGASTKLAGKVFRVNGKKYKTKRLIAEGGFGYVYLVEDEITGQQRALKHMFMQTREARESTLREIQLHTSLPNSPYLVSIIGSEVMRGPPEEAFVVMELCTGGNLADIINVAGPGGRGLPESRIWDIFFQVCQAVCILHEQVPIVVHRDIKAENVLICEDGRYKLCDFGSAKREFVFPSSDATRNDIQEDIDRFTTMVYRSPEMVDLYLERWIGDKADIWALGCLLFKMAYVVTPFEEGGRLGILNAKVDFPQTLSSSSYSDNLRSTIRWLLTPDPEERPNILDVLEKVSKYARTSWSRGSKKAPQHPPDPHGYGQSAPNSHSHKAPTSSLFDSLNWTPDPHAQPMRTQTPDAFFPSHAQNDFFSNPHHTPHIAFTSSDTNSSESGWAAFGPDTPHSTGTGADMHSFDAFSTTASHGSFESGSYSSHVTTREHHMPLPSSNDGPRQPVPSRLGPNNALAGSNGARSHRRSVSDSSALTASLSLMQLDGQTAFGQNGAPTLNAGVRPKVTADILRLPSLVLAVMSPDTKVPPLASMREMLTFTWAEPRQNHVSKIFQTLAPKINESPVTVLKGLYLVHRLITEGSDLVLTLCCNKFDFFKQIATQASGLPSSTPLRPIASLYAQYIVKKLEFHQSFENCFEGSYSLDAYFQRLRQEGKKLQIGAADSPFRRHVVPVLLDLQSAGLTLLEQFMVPIPNSPDLSSLKLHCSIPIVSDLCALLLLLQFVATKLLATKTDFTKAISQYEEQYSRMLIVFAKFASIAASPLSHGFPVTETAWAQSIKLPALGTTAPAVVKGSTSAASPPSIDPAVTTHGTSFGNTLIFDPLSEAEMREAQWVWGCLVENSPESAPATPPTVTISLSSSMGVPSPLVLQTISSDPSLYRTSESPTFSDSPSFTPRASFDSPALAPSFTPPPAFSAPTSSASPAQVKLDHFNATPTLSSSGFSQGDPFQALTSSISSGEDFSGSSDFNSFGAPSGMFVPSNRFAVSTPPVRASFDSNEFSPEPWAPMATITPPTRHLAASADQTILPPSHHSHHSHSSHHHLKSEPSGHHKKSHKKEKSDSSRSSASSSKHHQHYSSSGSVMVSTGSDGTLTSEDKLKNKEQLAIQISEFAAIQEKKGNSVCFDCGDIAPKWISLNLGVFICFRCSGIHRSFGTHISKVKSVQLDVLTPEQIDFFKHMGNRRAAKIWLANLPEDAFIPDRNSAQSDLERFLRDKYVFEEYKAKSSETSEAPSIASSSSRKGHSRATSHH